jgi:hypothetical protein
VKALPALRTATGLYGKVNPIKDHWLGGRWVHGGNGFKGFNYHPVIHMDCVRAELYIDTNDKTRNKRIYHALLASKDSIEARFGGPLDWQELPHRRACRICVHFESFGLTNIDHWDELITFLAENLAKLINAFTEIIDEVISL